jgi:hypothetical protein
VLFVVGTETAIVRTALVDAGLKSQRQVARLQKVATALPIARVAGDQRLLYAVIRTALLVPDSTVLFDDLRRDQPKAGLAH